MSGTYGFAFSISDLGVGSAPLLGVGGSVGAGGSPGNAADSDALVTSRSLSPQPTSDLAVQGWSIALRTISSTLLDIGPLLSSIDLDFAGTVAEREADISANIISGSIDRTSFNEAFTR